MVAVEVHEFLDRDSAEGPCKEWVDRVHTPFIAKRPDRTDRTWDWRNLIPALTFGVGSQRGPLIVQLRRQSDGFPLAMAAMLSNERWITNHGQPSIFLWYLTGAPKWAFAGQNAPKSITAAALDTAVAISLNGPSNGRTWLHAAPAGGDALLQWYRTRGLQPVDAAQPLPGPLGRRRPNDGRYFFHNHDSAKLACRSLHSYR